MMTDKMIKETLKKEIKSRFGHNVEIKLTTKRTCEINGKKLKLRIAYLEGYETVESALARYNANKTLANAKRVIIAYSDSYIKDFNAKLEAAYDNERKMLRTEVENYFN